MADNMTVLEEIERMRQSSSTPKPDYQEVIERSDFERIMTEVGAPRGDGAPERMAVRFAM